METAPDLPDAESTVNNFRILVAEDHPANRLLLGSLLQRLGYRNVDLCEDGAAAWQALADIAREPVRLLITDLYMPGLDGLALASRIRAAEAAGGMRLPILALTATTRCEALERCREAGIDAVLTKPVGLAELRDGIARLPRVAGPTAARRDGGCGPR